MAEDDAAFTPFPSIGKFADACDEMRHRLGRDPALPAVLRYRGTVKLHGTHADVVWQRQRDPHTPEEGTILFQSRNRVITPAADNLGFAAAMTERLPALRRLLQPFIAAGARSVALCGEWCGQGIQNKVAIATLPRFFVVLALRVDGRWHDLAPLATELRDHDARVYNIMEFPTYAATIDFSDPDAAQAQLVAITEAVDRECPVGAAMGVAGAGEGVVWTPAPDAGADADGAAAAEPHLWFKVKGAAHCARRVAAPRHEALRSMQQLVHDCVTESRCRQALDYVREMHTNGDDAAAVTKALLAPYMAWLVEDIWKEERPALEAGGFSKKDVRKCVGAAARAQFAAIVPTDYSVEQPASPRALKLLCTPGFLCDGEPSPGGSRVHNGVGGYGLR